MNFEEIDIQAFLYSAVPTRFQDTDPRDFEDFVGRLFEDNGYLLEQTSYSADFGADLIVELDGTRTAVQVKRFHEAHKVGVPEINQVIGAQQYYHCDQGMVITTSSYTSSARELAEKAEILLWDWYRLLQALADTYWGGLDYFEYYRRNPAQVKAGDVGLVFRLTEVEEDDLDEEGRRYVSAELENTSASNIQLFCELPTYITHARKQYGAQGWSQDSFEHGSIYAGATVSLAFYFSAKQVASVHPADRIILTLHMVPSGEAFFLEEEVGGRKKDCFLVTFVFGRHSQDYQAMIRFRDEILLPSRGGRQMVSVYYRLGTWLKPHLKCRPMLQALLLPGLKAVVAAVRRIHRL